MIKITADEAAMLRREGRSQDVHMANKTHKSRNKRYFASESWKTLKLLEKYHDDHVTFEKNGR